MRIGTWVPVYKDIIPIPKATSTAFGFRDGAELHLAPAQFPVPVESNRYDAEILVSPIPLKAWTSACRLSVRVRNRPGALARATKFLTDNKINILLTEACATYLDLGHWNAICDLSQVVGFERIKNLADENHFKIGIHALLQTLTNQLHEFVGSTNEKEFFPQGADLHAEFTAINGLNRLSFIANSEQAHVVKFTGGGLYVPASLVATVATICRIPHKTTLPDYAILTGNVQQTYLRIYFLRDYERMFRADLSYRLRDVRGGGIGVLNRILASLPASVNVLKLANHVTATQENIEAGEIEIIGQWLDEPGRFNVQFSQQEMEKHFRETIKTIKIQDNRNIELQDPIQVKDYRPPQAINPRVFISHSINWDVSKLERLKNALRGEYFEPVVGEDFESPVGSRIANQRLQSTPGVPARSFAMIHTCIIFISLVSKRPEFMRAESAGRKRYIWPSWVVAEEAYAYAIKREIWRLVDSDVESSDVYDNNLRRIDFTDDEDFDKKVGQLIRALNNYRRTPEFRKNWESIRHDTFIPEYGPSDN